MIQVCVLMNNEWRTNVHSLFYTIDLLRSYRALHINFVLDIEIKIIQLTTSFRTKVLKTRTFALCQLQTLWIWMKLRRKRRWILEREVFRINIDDHSISALTFNVSRNTFFDNLSSITTTFTHHLAIWHCIVHNILFIIDTLTTNRRSQSKSKRWKSSYRRTRIRRVCI